jgi:hypothetical protein
MFAWPDGILLSFQSPWVPQRLTAVLFPRIVGIFDMMGVTLQGWFTILKHQHFNFI